MDFSYLTAILILPVLGAIIIAFISSDHQNTIKRIAFVFTFIPLVLSIIVFVLFDKSLASAGIIQFEAPLDVSNVMLVCPQCDERTRVGIRREDGRRIRVCKKCGEDID